MLKLLPILSALFLLSFLGGQNDSVRENKIVRGEVVEIEETGDDGERKILSGVSLAGNQGSQGSLNPPSSESSYSQTTSEGISKSEDIDEVVKKVAVLESNSGKAPYGHHKMCEKKGLSNWFGYGVYRGVCFKDTTEAYRMVYRWFEEKLKTKDLPTSLCLYNTGKEVKECQYYLSYSKL